MDVKPVTLIGDLVRLEPLSTDHAEDLAASGGDEAIWQLLPYGLPTDPGHMAAFIRQAIARQQGGMDVPFAVIHKPTGNAVGCTRYMDIRPEHRGLEIGGTWYATEHQRTGVNTEAKLLLLQHAFEVLRCIRVQLKTDLRNERSQRAIERLGAVREGVLRNHIILADGYRRSTVMYSITNDEWPAVKARLLDLMARYR
ncbi:GNAT family protein [Isosphaeraceae bacterium EP7]